MSTIEDTSAVDAIGIDKNTGKVVLKIFDHLDWEDELSHLYLLQEKINSYLKFMESEQILNAYPDSKNRKLLIAISFREMPCANAIKFLDTASRLVLNAGFDLTYSIVNV
jgi:hypothetical protein